MEAELLQIYHICKSDWNKQDYQYTNQIHVDELTCFLFSVTNKLSRCKPLELLANEDLWLKSKMALQGVWEKGKTLHSQLHQRLAANVGDEDIPRAFPIPYWAWNNYLGFWPILFLNLAENNWIRGTSSKEFINISSSAAPVDSNCESQIP